MSFSHNTFEERGFLKCGFSCRMSGFMGTNTHKRSVLPWTTLEPLLAGVLVLCKSVLLWMRWGDGLGFDSGAHLEIVHQMPWNGIMGVRDTFYSYHPPLGFLLAKAINALGVPDVASVQLVSTLSLLAAFFFLRALLRRMNLLSTAGGVAFLYVVFGLPLITFVGSSINLDSIIFACACATLYYSVCTFWSREPSATHMIGLVTALAVAFLTKFSAMVLLSIPVIAASMAANGKPLIARLEMAAAACAAALLLVFPYYFTRYYRSEGHFLVSNTDFFVAEGVAESRQKRDANPAAFLGDLFHTPDAPMEITARDYGTIRLSDTWRDFWIRDAYLGPSSPKTLAIGLVELHAAVWLLLAGFSVYLLGKERRTAWNRLGGLLLPFAALTLVALIWYLYQTPFADWGPAKGIYVTPAVLGLGYLLASSLSTPLRGALWRGAAPRLALTGALAAFVIVNHLTPVY